MTKSKMNQNSAIGNANSALLETMFDFLAANSMYPMISKKGKIYFKCSRKVQLTQGKAEELIEQLEIKTAEDCERIRNEVKKRAAASRENRPIKEWIREERPREMLTKYSPESLPLSKLLAIILRIGKEGTSAEELSQRLLNKFGGLREIDSAPISEICKIEGIGPAKAAQIRAALEIGKRFFKESAQKQKRIKKPDDVIDYVAEYYGPYLRDAKKEFFHVILLDIKNKPMHNIEISKGSTNVSVVDPKEIMKEATLRSASSIILVHNHPSGDAEPSDEDIRITSCIIDACNLVGIKVLDHIIIGKNKEDYHSFTKSGLIR
ncbi:DNA repair protein RadC [Dehalococcoidia bacterium]|nr:DNA repair protein RadC [Dehalococcoidia bacterium]MCL0064596.1 DNA repair protein RadC [Dehalococcoidia bacterium]